MKQSFLGHKPGFYFFSAGFQQKNAWRLALQFFDETKSNALSSIKNPALFCFGTKFSPQAQSAFLQEVLAGESSILLGRQILEWREFIRSLARTAQFSQSLGLKEMNLASQREYFRTVLTGLENAGLIGSIRGLWKEEQFFSSLLREVEELRMAGIIAAEEVERSREALANNPKIVAEDLAHILYAYEKALGSGEERVHDFPSIVDVAKEIGQFPTLLPQGLFLYGLGALSLQEIELLQILAQYIPVFFSAQAMDENMEKVLREKKISNDLEERISIQNLRFLNTNYSGVVEHWKNSSDKIIDQNKHKKIPLLLAATPMEEARAAACFARSIVVDKPEAHVRFILPRDYFQSAARWNSFSHALGFPNLRAKNGKLSPLRAKILQQIFSCLELIREDFSLDATIDFAELLAVEEANSRFRGIAPEAARLGVRKGLFDWVEKSKNSKLEAFGDFVQLLREFHQLFPASGQASDYHTSLLRFCEKSSIAELVLHAKNSFSEQELQRSFAALLRNSALIASSTKLSMSFATWLSELKKLVASTALEDLGQEAKNLEIYFLGDLLPPSPNNTFTVFLGLNAGIEPDISAPCFLPERARRSLKQWNCNSRIAMEQEFLYELRTIVDDAEKCYFSYAQYDEDGKELSASWCVDLFATEEMQWPSVSFLYQQETAIVAKNQHDFSTEKLLDFKKYSASLFEAYQKCPFRALVERIWRVEDSAIDPSLDLSPMDEGQIYHRAMEIYFQKKNGRYLATKEERAVAIHEAIDTAGEEMRLEYYKGSVHLFSIQKKHWKRILENFVEEESAYFASAPDWGVPLCEQKFEGVLADQFPYSGKIDRIDMDKKNGNFAVLDYKKSSTPRSKEVLELKNFQVPLYVAAAQKITRLNPVASYFLSLKSAERSQGLINKNFNRANKKDISEGVKYFFHNARNASLVEEEKFHELCSKGLEEAARLAALIQEGKFPVAPDDEVYCQTCSARPACRIREEKEKIYVEHPKLQGSQKEFSALANISLEVPVDESTLEEKKLTEEQEAAVNAEDGMVFVEASAGTGKTTMLAEKYVKALENIATKENISLGQAAEKIIAISFTEKSAAELSHRIHKKLLHKHDAILAAQSTHSVSTIHGLCRKILSDFPLLAGVDPQAKILDEIESENLRKDIFEEFFLQMDSAVASDFQFLYERYSRAELQNILHDFLLRRSILEADFSQWKKIFQSPSAALENYIFDSADQENTRRLLALFENLCARYDVAKKRRSVLDFNDLERLAFQVLQEQQAQTFYQKQYSLLMVDEFQDTNAVQRNILHALARKHWANVFVVGDAKQSIYRFRAADVSVFQNLRKEAEKTGRLFSLTKNYRSQKNIVDFANLVTEKILPQESDAPEYEAGFTLAKAHHAPDEPITILQYRNQEESKRFKSTDKRAVEANLLVNTIRDLQKQNIALNEIAILFRKMTGVQVYFEALQANKIPFVVSSCGGFFNNPVILDALALLRVLSQERNHFALLTLLRSPWFSAADMELQKIFYMQDKNPWMHLEKNAKRWQDLFTWKSLLQEIPLSQLLGTIFIKHPAYAMQRERLQLDKFSSMVEKLEGDGLSVYAIAQELSRIGGWDSENAAEGKINSVPEPNSSGAVRISTIHAAKGLEYPVVLLPDLSSNTKANAPEILLLPGRGTAWKNREGEKTPAYTQLQEEDRLRDQAEAKRLFYVALTRAKEKLFLFLPEEDKKESKNPSFADWIRDVKSDSCFKKIIVQENTAETIKTEKFFGTESVHKAQNFSIPAAQEFLQLTSVTELASYQFCPEFHRLKFVQQWDDAVLALWKKPKDGYKKFKFRTDLESEEMRALLKGAGIEKKERGIALHRVLERIEDSRTNENLWRLWLEEAYVAQGVSLDKGASQELLQQDLQIIKKFLLSEMGQTLFNANYTAYPELPFLWHCNALQIHGTMDRVVSRSPREWIVADYKSSSTEKSFARYRFQVATYVGALHTYLESKKIVKPVVHAYLIDLYSGESTDLAITRDEAIHLLRGEIKNIRDNYLLQTAPLSLEERKITGTENCFLCPYSLHCDAGKKIVLTS